MHTRIMHTGEDSKSNSLSPRKGDRDHLIEVTTNKGWIYSRTYFLDFFNSGVR